MYQTYIKRTLDVVVAFALIIVASPIALIVVIAIKLNDRDPVVFKHQRFGQNKMPFTIYKFRTMTIDTPSETPTNSLRNPGAAITRPGKWIRKLSLDELPQLINVLKGEMSIVGPRPVVLKELSLIKERDKYGANACKPGITGWAQVNGRDEMRMKKKAKMDGEYVSRLGVIMDIKCVAMTFWAVVSVKGHKEGGDEDIEAHLAEEQGFRTQQDND